jgi:hypothetical protein
VSAVPELHDVACVVHLHSTYSDGTGTVPEIMEAGRRAGVDCVLLTDHDTLEAKHRGHEGWHGSTLLLVGEEVSPPNQNHYLAFDIDEVVPRRRMTPAKICAAVEAGGGFGFAAHPFSRGSERFKKLKGYPWRDIDCDGLRGIELWSFANDTAERLSGIREALAFLAWPARTVDHPPADNVAEWDRLCRDRQVVAIGGLDAHQYGKRIRGHVPIRLMSYRRSFRYLRTHALCERPLVGELEHDREQIYSALREGRCYLAMDSLAPAGGFGFWAEGANGEVIAMGAERAGGDWTLRVRLPRTASWRLVRDGEVVATGHGEELEHGVEAPGAHRVEARLHAHGRERTWILSNPIYLR